MGKTVCEVICGVTTILAVIIDNDDDERAELLLSHESCNISKKYKKKVNP